MSTQKRKQSIFERFPVLKTIPNEKFPYHIFIIPDGNGRWSQKLHNIVLKGHEKGAQVILHLLRELGEIEAIKIVTIWGFAADNWKRTKQEVTGLMRLFKSNLEDAIEELRERNGRFIHLGRKERISPVLRETIERLEKETAKNNGQIICIAIDFGGEDQEIRIVEKAKHLESSMEITKDVVWSLRDGGGLIPPADLLIRTSGEKRTSDVGWLNGSSTELFFIDKLFPDITTADIVEAIVDFSKRERRFGARLSMSSKAPQES